MRILALNSICLVAIFGIASAQTGVFPAVLLFARLDFTNECTRVTKMLDASCYNIYNMIRSAYEYYMDPLFHAITRFNAAYADLIAQSGLDPILLSDVAQYVSDTIEPSFVTWEQHYPHYEKMILMDYSTYISNGVGGGCGGTQCSYAVEMTMQSSSFFSQLTHATDGNGVSLSNDCKVYIIQKFLEVYKDRAQEVIMILVEKMGSMPNTAAPASDRISEIIEILDDLVARMNACQTDANVTALIAFMKSCTSNCINEKLTSLLTDMHDLVQQDVSDTAMEITGNIGWVDYVTQFASFCPQEP